MVVALCLLALIFAALGGFMLTQATVGVGLIGGACLFAIFARIVQSAFQHERILQALNNASQRAEPYAAVSIGGPWECQSCGQRNSQQARACTRCGTARPPIM